MTGRGSGVGPKRQRIGLPPAATLGVALAAMATPGHAADRPPEPKPLAEVIVSASRQNDAVITARVERALADDPYIYGEHITVSTSNGVVTCEGIVGDVFELFRVLRLCRKFSTGKRMINGLEINAVLPDGG